MKKSVPPLSKTPHPTQNRVFQTCPHTLLVPAIFLWSCNLFALFSKKYIRKGESGCDLEIPSRGLQNLSPFLVCQKIRELSFSKIEKCIFDNVTTFPQLGFCDYQRG